MDEHFRNAHENIGLLAFIRVLGLRGVGKRRSVGCGT